MPERRPASTDSLPRRSAAPGEGADGLDPALARVAGELGRLQDHRGRRFRDVSIDGLLDRIRREAKRDMDRLGGIAEAWQQAVPEGLLERTALVSLRAGVLTVAVDGPSTKYRLDRLLRGRGLADLRAASRLPVARVKTQLDPSRFADDHDDDPKRMPPEVEVRTPRRS